VKVVGWRELHFGRAVSFCPGWVWASAEALRAAISVVKSGLFALLIINVSNHTAIYNSWVSTNEYIAVQSSGWRVLPGDDHPSSASPLPGHFELASLPHFAEPAAAAAPASWVRFPSAQRC
jgi:hypothetical protein